MLQLAKGLIVIITCTVVQVKGHGRLVDPPSRGSMWRYGFNTPHNYDDNQLFCGGVYTQHQINGGMCGICGDPYNGPRLHEGGGPYATGIIVRQYVQGQRINVSVQITASHLGWFQFRLCPHDSPSTPASQECLDQHLLSHSSGTNTFYGITFAGWYNLTLQLPENVTCTQCVFQWKYNAGNSWGVDDNGIGGLGLGAQEQFYGCADVAIIPAQSTEDDWSNDDIDGGNSGSWIWNQETDTNNDDTNQDSWNGGYDTGSTNDGSNVNCRVSDGAYKDVPGMTQWCIDNCALGYCPATHCVCDEYSSVNEQDDNGIENESTNDDTGNDTDNDVTGNGLNLYCVAGGANINTPGMDDWCMTNCATGDCPATHCACFSTASNDDPPQTDGIQEICRGAGTLADNPDVNRWCLINCALGNCPTAQCTCSACSCT